MKPKGDKTLADLDERQRKLYDLLVGTYKMKPRRAFLAVCGTVMEAGDGRKPIPRPPWEFIKDGWVLTCPLCPDKKQLQTACWSQRDAAEMAVRLGWKATVHVVRCPACRASLR